MIFNSVFYFLGTKTGKKKDGTDWNLVQTLDNDEKHFNFFVKDLKKFEKLKENDEIQLTLDLYYDLKSKSYKVFVKEVL